MEVPPLSLNILRLTPTTLFIPSPPLDPTQTPPAQDVPLQPLPRPSLPSSFSFSPTHNYPAPFGIMTLGSSLSLKVQLVSTPSASGSGSRVSSPRVDVKDDEGGDIGTKMSLAGSGGRGGRGGREGEGEGVKGVRMMLEVQGPGGRWRLGEVIHGEETTKLGDPTKEEPEPEPGQVKQANREAPDAEEGDPLNQGPETPRLEQEAAAVPMPVLYFGQFVELDVAAEMKELGLQVLICSVAWETDTGRRTFQRFFKFNVVAPLAIKTKIHPSLTPASLLDPEKRGDVYLEVLMQNTSAESILFDKVNLEPVFGMTCTSITPTSLPTSTSTRAMANTAPESMLSIDTVGSLHPGDTRQYLFLLHPSPPPPTRPRLSVFPPQFPPGTVLPLGRLDMAWYAGQYREPGRLQTSTLNRRITTQSAIPKITGTSSGQNDQAGDEGWEFDLAVTELDRQGVEVDREFKAKLRVAVRGSETFSVKKGEEELKRIPPRPLRLGIQYLTAPPLGSATTGKEGSSFNVSGPSRSTTPLPPATPSKRGISRPFSPGTPSSAAGPSSRPMSPISSQLRHAAQSHLQPNTTLDTSLPPGPPASQPSTAPFPPPPYPSRTPQTAKPPISNSSIGEIFPLGPSLLLPPPEPFELVQEQYSTTYADSTEPPERWETVYEAELRFMPVEEGLAGLGGVRVLVMDEEGGWVGGEWETLGDVWIVGSGS